MHFKLFLKDQEMENVKNFTIQDMLALKTIPETISKMEEVLEQLRPEFEKNFGNYAREKTFNYSYNGFATFKFELNTYYLAAGFLFYDNIEIPTFGLWFNIPKKKLSNSGMVRILKEELINKNGWRLDDDDISPYLLTPITEFVNNQDDCIPSMKDYIGKGLETLYDIKLRYPKILKGS